MMVPLYETPPRPPTRLGVQRKSSYARHTRGERRRATGHGRVRFEHRSPTLLPADGCAELRGACSRLPIAGQAGRSDGGPQAGVAPAPEALVEGVVVDGPPLAWQLV